MKSFKLFVVLVSLLSSLSSYGLEFKKACKPRQNQIIIGAVGDLLIHKYIHMAAQKREDHYSYLWRNIESHIRAVDVMYANLETPLARGVGKNLKIYKDPGVYWDKNEWIYSGYPEFNTHPVLAKNLKAGGFDIVSTANNHAADRGAVGIDLTTQALNQAGLLFTGTRARGATHSYITLVKTKGWTLAFIACTYGVNGSASVSNQVFKCYSQKQKLLKEIQRAHQYADAVIVTPHWGTENSFTANSKQISLGQDLAEAGANAIIGTHAHRIQPMERYVTQDGREVPIIYGTGNFVSSQAGINKLGLMVLVGLSKSGNKVWVNGVRYLPLYMRHSYLSVDFLDRLPDQQKRWNVVSQVLGDEQGLMGSREAVTTTPFCD